MRQKVKSLKVEELKEGNKALRYKGHKRARCLGGLRNSLLTLISYTSIPLSIHTSKKLYAFTMAEILVSLTIIGIIAAITLPSLIGNMNEKTFATKRKALHARMTQAISMMPSLNGYGVGENDTQTAQNATQAFITNGLSKVLKISNICDNENLKKCGFPDKFTKMGTNSKIDTPKKLVALNKYFINNAHVTYSQIDTNTAAFETANGESVLTFYNPNCSYTYGVNGATGLQNLMQPTMCANFIFDLNGLKGPNKVGKDIGFMTAFYPTDSEVVAPMPAGTLRLYKADHPYSIGWFNASCRKDFGSDTKMANIEEIKSVFTNNELGYSPLQASSKVFIVGDAYITSTVVSGKITYLAGYTGGVYTDSMSNNSFVEIFCVKK